MDEKRINAAEACLCCISRLNTLYFSSVQSTYSKKSQLVVSEICVQKSELTSLFGLIIKSGLLESVNEDVEPV
jgi:hypothetical protein